LAKPMRPWRWVSLRSTPSYDGVSCCALRAISRAGPAPTVRHEAWHSPVADLVRDSRGFRRGSRIGSAPTRRPPVGARPARDSRAGPAPTVRHEAWHSPVGADLVRDSRRFRRSSRIRSAPTRRPPAGAQPARDSRAGPAPTVRHEAWHSPVGADLFRDSRGFRRGSRIGSAPTQRPPAGTRPARDFAGRARSYSSA